MTGPFELAGYDVLAPLGASQSTWRAVDLVDGSRVVLRRVPAAATSVAEIRRRAAVWGSLPRVGVAAVRDVVAAGVDLVVVTEFAAGGGLDLLLAAQRTLSAGQVVTLVAPLAETLATAHGRGLVHGRVHARNILLDRAGRPTLTDCVFGAGGDPRSDVAALAGLALGVLRDDAPPGLLALLRAAASPRSGETSAAALAAAALAAAPAQPLLAASPAPAGAVPDGRAAKHVRTTVAMTAVVAVVAVGAGARCSGADTATGTATGTASPVGQRGRPVTAGPSVGSSPSVGRPGSLAHVVGRLEMLRQRALATASARLLAHADVPGTELWQRDRRVVAALRAGDAHAVGAHATVVSVQVQRRHDAAAVVRVVDVLSSYDVVNGDGGVLAHHPRRTARVVLLVLTRHDGEWRISRVTPRSR